MNICCFLSVFSKLQKRYIRSVRPVQLQAIIEQGGLAPGGLNFDCKIRRESTDLEDMFIAHIGKHVIACSILLGRTGTSTPAACWDS